MRYILSFLILLFAALPAQLKADCETCYPYDTLSGTGGYGYSVAIIDDLDNDGVDDFIIGAPYYDNDRGQVNVYSAFGDSIIFGSYNGQNEGDRFGWSVANVGDVNGDDTTDFAVGAPKYVSYNSYVGRAYVYSGANGNLIGYPRTGSEDQQLGYSIDGAGDWDNDDTCDIIIGAPMGSYGGHVYIDSYSGSSWTHLTTLHIGWTNDRFGHSVAGGGRIDDEDGDDVIVGAPNPYYTDGIYSKVWAFSGGTGDIIESFFGGDCTKMGWAVAAAGDIDGDTYNEIMATEPDVGDSSLVWVFKAFNGSGTLHRIATAKYDIYQDVSNNISGIRDVNHDGISDIIFGRIASSLLSCAFVYSGKPPTVLGESELLQQICFFYQYGHFGQTVAGSDPLTGGDNAYMLVGAGMNNIVFAYNCLYNRTYYVDSANGNDENNGCEQYPFEHIQTGIDAAYDGDTVFVKYGTYSGDGNRNLHFHDGIDISLIGISGADSTIIDLDSVLQYPAITIDSGQSTSTIIDGFTIRNARVGLGNQAAGITIKNSSPIIRNCTVEHCEQINSSGGAIYIYRGSARIEDCTFSNNTATPYHNTQTGTYTGGAGGAIFVKQGYPVIDECIFKDNNANLGGAIHVSFGILEDTLLNVTITDCLFHDNSARNDSGTAYGGALFLNDSTTVTGCTFAKNDADRASVMALFHYFDCTVVDFDKNIVAFNTGSETFYTNGTNTDLSLACNLFWENPGIFAGDDYDCDDVDNTNQFLDPMFCDPDNDNYSISSNSPCHPDNNPCEALIGAVGDSCLYSLDAGPTLTVPQDGDTTYDHTEELYWQPITGIINYEVWYDESDIFCDIQRSCDTITDTTWEVDPYVYDDTYYWKVRGYDGSDWTDWSETRSLIVKSQLPHNPSCPVLFSYGESGFIEEGTLLAASKESGYSEAVTDYRHIASPLSILEGKARFVLREMEDEVTYLHDFELITVDHSAASRMGVSAEGKITVYEGVIPPLTAVDHLGIDRLDEVSAEDEIFYTCSGPGHLELTYPNPGVDCIMLGVLFKDDCPLIPKVAVDDDPDAPQNLTLEYRDTDGNWYELPRTISQENNQSMANLCDVPTRFGADNIHIRISWTGDYRADALCQFIPSGETPEIKRRDISQFYCRFASDPVDEWTGFHHSGPLVMTRGDEIEFTFDVGDTPAPDQTRDYIIKAVGRYHPDYGVYGNLVPSTFSLYSNTPNPFNPSTVIGYDVPKAVHVKLEVINILGQHVTTLVDGIKEAGHHEVTWNSTYDNGDRVASGIYFYRLQADDFVETKKMVLLK